MRLLFLLLVASMLLSVPLSVSAGDYAECVNTVDQGIASLQRRYRIELFGQRKAKDAPINDIRFDSEGKIWLKSEENTWITAEMENKGNSWADNYPDSRMDKELEHPDLLPHKGIFETKRMTTSELIPYLLTAFRAFDCELDAFCMQVTSSTERFEEQNLPIEDGTLRPRGCIAFDRRNTILECHLGEPGKEEGKQQQREVFTRCRDMAAQTLKREADLLRFAVMIDAGYRSLLQLSGNFDLFLQELRWPLAGTVRQVVSLLGNLQRIPCFVAACESYPPPAKK